MPANIGPTIRVDGEKDYRDQMQRIIQQTRTLSAEMKNLSSGFDQNSSALKRSQDSVKNLNAQVKLQQDAIGQMTDMLKKASAAYEADDPKLQRYKENIAKAENELGQMEEALKKATSEMRIEQSIADASSSSHLNLKNAVTQVVNEMKSNKVIAAQLKEEYSDSKIRVAALEKEMLLTAKTEGVQSDRTKELASQLKDAKSEMERLRSEFQTAKKDAEGMGNDFLLLRDKIKELGDKVKDLGDKFKYVATHPISSLGSAIKTGFKGAVDIGVSAAKTFIKSVAAIGTAAAAGIVALGKVGLEYNSQMETYTTNFETMLGSKADAEQKVAELKTMAAKTPFDMDTLAGATQQLLAMNVASEDTGKYLQQLGDISLGDKSKLESLTNAFGKMSSTGKVTLENINMMAEQGFNPLNVIAQQTGESMTDLYQRVSDGKVSFDEIKMAMELATGENGKFHDGMKRASETTEGMISTLKDNARALVGEVFQPISDGLKERLLPGAIDAIDTLTSEFRTNGVDGMISAASDMIANALGQFADSLPNFVNTALQIVSSLGEGIRNNQSQIADGVVKTITTLVSGLIAALPDLLKTGAKLVIEIAKGLAQSLPEIAAQAVKMVTELISSLWDNRREILQAGADIVQGIIDGIASAWTTLTSWFEDLWNSLFGKRTVDVSVNASSTGRTGRRVNGSHASGLNYVPFDNYLANLHQGEMVLTRRQADELRNTGYMTLPAKSAAGGPQQAQGGGETYNFGGFNFYVYQREGEDGEALARRVMEMMQTEVERRKTAIAG